MSERLCDNLEEVEEELETLKAKARAVLSENWQTHEGFTEAEASLWELVK